MGQNCSNKFSDAKHIKTFQDVLNGVIVGESKSGDNYQT